MKVELTDLSPVKKRMSIEVGAEDVARETQQLARNYARKVRLPGFRPGKAPLSLVRSRFAREIEADVKERMVSRYYHEATASEGLSPLGDPVVDEVQYEEGRPLTFRTTFEVLPQIELRDYRGIEVRRPAVAVSDAEVDEALESLRGSRTQLHEHDAPAETGHVIVADVHGNPEGGEPFEQQRAYIEIGAGEHLPAFNEKLIGASAGDRLEFAVDYPQEYPASGLAGRTVGYEIQVHEVKVKVVPELDDEFAKDLGDFADLAALKERIRHDLTHRKEHEVEATVRQSVLDRVLTDNPIVLPEVLVDVEVRQRLEELVRRLITQGVDLDRAEIDWKELRERQVEPARKTVHAQLVLDAVAAAESLEVTPVEVEARIRADAERLGENADKVLRDLKKRHATQALTNQLLREKALDLLMAVANIQNEE